MAWQPEKQPLREFVGYLKDALSGRDQNAQRHATTMLGQAKSSPETANYLAYILSNGPLLKELGLNSSDNILVRSSAAINLKNTIKAYGKAYPDTDLAYARSLVLTALQDSNSQIRNFAGSVISEVVQRGGILGWPELLPELLALAGNDTGNVSPEAQEGAMSALAKICEDNKQSLDQDYNGQRPLAIIIPKLLDITSSPNAKVRSFALASINAFLPQTSPVVTSSLDAILAQLFRLANDPSDAVRRNVCRSFTHLVDVRPDKIKPHMSGLVDFFVLQQRSTDDPDLALDAAEFWLCVGENRLLCPSLGPFLEKIVPVLLESMVYEEEDIIRIEGEAEDADQDDRAEDLKPQFATTKNPRLATNGHVGTNGEATQSSLPNAIDDDLSDGEIEESDDGVSGNVEERWNLRKCSAAALDVLASNFHDPVFTITLPYLNENLRHQDWPIREAAVLAVGAVADGCMDAVTPHLPDLIPYLLSFLNDREPTIRLITCWALGRYSSWASHLQDPNDRQRYFEPMMEGILTRMLDPSKKVQEAAASAFANLEEKATKGLTPYCGPIIRQFVQCFNRYKDRNMFILYDCVQTLAEHVGPALAQQELIDTLMPAIIERWSKVSDRSQEIFPLLECLSYVATALGDAFAPFAVGVFPRCIRIIHQCLEEYIMGINNEALDKPSKDFLVTSLDLLSAVIQALDAAKSSELVQNSQPRFFDLLLFCMEDPSNDVRQSSYALLGDCAINVFGQLQPFLPAIIPVLIQQLDLDKMKDEDIESGFSVINNACWSCGEIAMKEKAGMEPYVDQIYQHLLGILRNPEVPRSVNENAVIALGRLGVYCSPILAPNLGEFAKSFLSIIGPVEYTDEKAHALVGFNRTVERNPQAMEDCLVDYFKAGAAYARHSNSDSSAELAGSFQRNLVGYKSMIPGFEPFLQQLPERDIEKLRGSFNI
ncbi:MAG: hypothetical protein L6R39_002367 [Caloplaca ligustica]|nr:MAG: hypothetical protein L6R39_002367 [Caloplaca ligustica]